MMSDFGAGNTCGISLEQAMDVALRAEASRDFTPALPGGLTVGLSSGTCGSRGVFVVGPDERVRWAGVLLARALPTALLRRVLQAWQPPLRIAFFLRANSNLYTTLASRRIGFRFFDLLQGVEAAWPALIADAPDVLVAPASVLQALALRAISERVAWKPLHVISVAEVLEPDHAQAVRDAFGCTPHQLYQATEGFLGYTCEQGSLHLNECFVHVEPEWLDAERTRFRPLITDFSRHVQLIVRYRLNDVLRVAERPCACGRAEQTLAAIEGRCDDVLWLAAGDISRAVPVFADVLRQALLIASPALRQYRIEQHGLVWQIALQTDGDGSATRQAVQREIAAVCTRLNAKPPFIRWLAWQADPPGAKLRRLRCVQPLQGFSCTF
jgi:putative adenylate-forming enzyme